MNAHPYARTAEALLKPRAVRKALRPRALEILADLIWHARGFDWYRSRGYRVPPMPADPVLARRAAERARKDAGEGRRFAGRVAPRG